MPQWKVYGRPIVTQENDLKILKIHKMNKKQKIWKISYFNSTKEF